MVPYFIPPYQSPGFNDLPEMSGTLCEWFQPMTFVKITKQNIDFQDVETATDINFLGVWQVFSSQKLLLKPEQQRAWKWFTVHAQPSLTLIPDEVIRYLGQEYKVMEKLDYSAYGYVEYHLVNNFTGSGPVTP